MLCVQVAAMLCVQVAAMLCIQDGLARSHAVQARRPGQHQFPSRSLQVRPWQPGTERTPNSLGRQQTTTSLSACLLTVQNSQWQHCGPLPCSAWPLTCTPGGYSPASASATRRSFISPTPSGKSVWYLLMVEQQP